MRVHEGAAIRVREDAAGRPATLTIHGETHRVETIEEVREPRLDWWSPSGEIHRVYYLVTTHLGWICEVYRDVAGSGWYLARRFD